MLAWPALRIHEGALTVEKQISHCAVTLWHLPIVNRNLGCLHLFPLGETTCIKVLDLACICDDCLLLKVPDETVNGTRAEEVGEEQSVTPNTLRSEHHEAHKRPWTLHLQEHQQVHTLVVALLEQGFDPGHCALAEISVSRRKKYVPSIVSLHSPHRMQVT